MKIWYYLRWFLYVPVDLLTSILAYPLVPIAILLQKDGELRSWFWWLGTYDAPIDGEPAHKERWKAFRERYGAFGLYCQRVGWLWRNKAYNFAYWQLGVDVTQPIKWYGNTKTESGKPGVPGSLWIFADNCWSWFAFIPWLTIGKKQLCLRVYCGWKLKGRCDDRTHTSRQMLAFHINPFRIRDKP